MKSLLVRLVIIFILSCVFLNFNVEAQQKKKEFLHTEGLESVFINGKYGFKDDSGKIVIEPKFDKANFFSEGLCSVEIGSKWGFIDKTGKLIIEAKFDSASFFSEGIASVKKDKKWGFIDKKGNYTIDLQFEDAGEFSEGLAAIKIGGKWGYIDKTGNRLIEPQFEDVDKFFDGIAAVKIGEKWGFINKKGRIVIEIKFEYRAKYFKPFFYMGKAKVMIDGKWEYIDRTGRIAGNWDYCSGSKDYILYYDKINITRLNKNTIRVWAKFVDKEELTYSVNLNEINCVDKKIRLLSYGSYDKDGGVVKLFTPIHDQPILERITPDSVGEDLYKKVCK